MDEKQGPICARVRNSCDQCLRNRMRFIFEKEIEISV